MRAGAPWLFALGVLLLVAVALVGDVSMGAQRWLDLKVVRFQPSEIMKLAVPLACAWYLRDHHQHREPEAYPRRLAEEDADILAGGTVEHDQAGRADRQNCGEQRSVEVQHLEHAAGQRERALRAARVTGAGNLPPHSSVPPVGGGGGAAVAGGGAPPGVAAAGCAAPFGCATAAGDVPAPADTAAAESGCR